jgi:hypothetical protein
MAKLQPNKLTHTWQYACQYGGLEQMSEAALKIDGLLLARLLLVLT